MRMGFLPLLTLIFVVAKLAGAIAWSWWLVFTPVLIGIGIGAGFFLALAVIAVVAALRS